jgi:protein-S-isoprenylcysteine O-methyltransferase Ste14
VHALELRVPPVAVASIMALVMALVAWAVPAFSFVCFWSEPVAAGLAVAGIAVSLLGVRSFQRAGTTVNPLKLSATSSLVVSGVYSLTRNPMYLGFLLILSAWATFLSNAISFLLLPVFAAFMNRFQIEPEERALTAIFGQDFQAYKSRVRRWL